MGLSIRQQRAVIKSVAAVLQAIKADGCGANGPGGGGFQPGNTCGGESGGGGGGGDLDAGFKNTPTSERITVNGSFVRDGEWLEGDDIVREAAKMFNIEGKTGKDIKNNILRQAGIHGAKDSNIYVKDKGIIVKVDSHGSGGKYTAERVIHKDHVKNSAFYVSEGMQGQGIGAKMLAVQAAQLQGTGKKITTHAAGSAEDIEEGWGDEVGYYAWPRLGYDGDLDPDLQDLLRKGKGGPELKKLAKEKETLRYSDVMPHKEGRKFIKNFGFGAELEFDPTPGSYSMRVLSAYLKEKGIKP